MTNKDIGVLVGSLLTTLLGEKDVPQSPLWLALSERFPEIDVYRFQGILDVLAKQGLVTTTSTTVTLTEKGTEKAKLIEQFIQKQP